jgi:hypothetical protein
MSSVAIARTGGAATQAIASAENSTMRWLKEVIDGNGGDSRIAFETRK